MNQLEFWHAYVNSKNIKDVYLKNNWVNQIIYILRKNGEI